MIAGLDEDSESVTPEMARAAERLIQRVRTEVVQGDGEISEHIAAMSGEDPLILRTATAIIAYNGDIAYNDELPALAIASLVALGVVLGRQAERRLAAATQAP